jgi:hypothetical protein
MFHIEPDVIDVEINKDDFDLKGLSTIVDLPLQNSGN